ncbi:LysR family transcriptional regulator [Thalassococcus sp. S3]|uniref:LysR family transcriptional regulator n=1 Tax=Thalassococcus sp. S3 TaxID=2017482 RepID=UPI0010247C15|nr:LysR family transcriptional regulator [Thalassococcus sp. S3]QBF29888.1 LysR family transcriptional regulator [Thalassococcus sp. S3]
MSEKRLSWDDLRLFLGVAEAASLAKAVDKTGASPPTLGRRMDRLEQSLGVKLFERHARGYDLTAHGSTLLARVRDIEQRVIEAEQDVASEAGPEVIRISAGTWMTTYITEKIGQISAPDDTFQLYLSAEERRADIGRREALIGFRNMRPEEPNLATRKLCRIEYAGYAVDHAVKGWIQVGADTPSARWVRAHHASEIVIGASTPIAGMQLCLAGMGRMALPCFIGDHDHRLKRLGENIHGLSTASWIVTHPADRHRPNVRKVIDRFVSVITLDAPRFAGATRLQIDPGMDS